MFYACELNSKYWVIFFFFTNNFIVIKYLETLDYIYENLNFLMLNKM